MMQAYPGAVRVPTFSIGDIYPESKGPAPSTAQLANPHEVAAAAGVAGSATLASVPSMNPAELVKAPVFWILAALAVLFVLGARR